MLRAVRRLAMVGLAFSLGLASSAARAEPASEPAASPPGPALTGWLAAGGGGGRIGAQGGGGFRLEAAVARGRRLFSLRYAAIEDSNGSCGGLFCGLLGPGPALPRNSNEELAAQFGYARRLDYALVTASGGAALLRTVERGHTLLSADYLGSYYDSTTRWTAGLAGELGAYVSSRYMSIGPAFLADFNPVQSHWVILLDVHVGWMGRAPSDAAAGVNGSVGKNPPGSSSAK
jgi:hypothetical protein